RDRWVNIRAVGACQREQSLRGLRWPSTGEVEKTERPLRRAREEQRTVSLSQGESLAGVIARLGLAAPHCLDGRQVGEMAAGGVTHLAREVVALASGGVRLVELAGPDQLVRLATQRELQEVQSAL